ncbi:MAG: hypothetical protein KF716_27980 [Anaerolineae bacterium]|nr:hypothetical protein [Anaerolineae bacterium]
MRTAFFIPAEQLIDFIAPLLPEFRGVYHPPIPKSESLTSNLLSVQSYPSTMYVATALVKNPKEIAEKLRQLNHQQNEWSLVGNTLLSFRNFDSPNWVKLCDQDSIEEIPTEEWASSRNEAKQREFVFLLNKCVQAKVRGDLRYFREKDYYHFKATPDLSNRIYHYQPGKRKTEKIVFGASTFVQNGNPYYYRHFAFKGHFKRYDELWYLEITPTYHFTTNGYDLHFNYEVLMSGIKKLERNGAILGQVRAWVCYLTETGDIFTPVYPLLSFGRLQNFEADFGVNDSAWVEKESSIDQLTNSMLDTPLE